MECLKNGGAVKFYCQGDDLVPVPDGASRDRCLRRNSFILRCGEAVVDDNTITVYVKRIRNKIEDDPKQPRYLKTVRGIGYMLNV